MTDDSLGFCVEFFGRFRIYVHGVLDDLSDVAERGREDLIPQSIFRALLAVLVGIRAGRNGHVRPELADIFFEEVKRE